MKQTQLRRINGLVVLAVVFLLLAVATLGLVLTRQASTALIGSIHDRMLDISNTAAAMLDGDALDALTAEDADSPEYRQILKTLTYFQDNIALKYIYCIEDAGNGNFVFSVDPAVEDPGEFGTPIVYTPALYQASLGTPAVDEEPYSDAWGNFYSAYSPVFNAKGQVAGIVAVDFDAEWYDDQVSALVRIVVAGTVVSLVIGCMIVVLATRRRSRQYRELYGELSVLAGKVEELVREIETGSLRISQESTSGAPEESAKILDAEDLGKKILSMQDTIRQYIERAHRQAYLDGLTGARNKAAYLDTVRNLDAMIQEEIAAFSVAVFDLNSLKHINDNYGHEAGDAALIDAAKLLCGVFGQDNIFRVGGDEFIAIIKITAEEDMQKLFGSLDAAIMEHNRAEHCYQRPLAISKGFAIYRKGEDEAFRNVFKRADECMYADKALYYTKYGDRRRR